MNNQPMPAGSTVAFSVGGDGSLVGTSSFTVPCSINDTAVGNRYFVSYKAPTEAGSAALELKVTTPAAPKGSATTTLYGITIVSPPPP